MSKQYQALFNEIKGSLFEYMVAHDLSRSLGIEANFIRNLPEHYQSVLSQQDRMTRELYPELVEMLPHWSKQTAIVISDYNLNFKADKVKLTGQYSNSLGERHETDFILESEGLELPISLKLNKKSSAVNTKSGGIKSFLTEYFPGEIAEREQSKLSLLVDSTFSGLYIELHEAAGINPENNWEAWRKNGLSELPGELPDELSKILLRFYSVLSKQLKESLEIVAQSSPENFINGLMRLVGMGLPSMVQVICFHDINGKIPERVNVLIHNSSEVLDKVKKVEWPESRDVSFFTLRLDTWELSIRIKPMNKFTTTAIKINCAVKY